MEKYIRKGHVVAVDPKLWTIELKDKLNNRVGISLVHYSLHHAEPPDIQLDAYVELINIKVRHSKRTQLADEFNLSHPTIFAHKLSTVTYTPASELPKHPVKYNKTILKLLHKYDIDVDVTMKIIGECEALIDITYESDPMAVRLQRVMALVQFYMYHVKGAIEIPVLLTVGTVPRRPLEQQTLEDRKGPAYTFRIQQNGSAEMWLFGFLDCDNASWFYIRDRFDRILCKIMGEVDVSSCMNSFIICKGFMVASESYILPRTVRLYQYLLIRQEDIYVLFKNVDPKHWLMKPCLLLKQLPPKHEYLYKYTVLIQYICTITVQEDGKKLRCVAVSMKENPVLKYLLMDENYSSTVILMQPGQVYDMYLTKRIGGEFCPELQRAARCQSREIGRILQDSAVFVRSECCPPPPPPCPGTAASTSSTPMRNVAITHVHTMKQITDRLRENSGGRHNNMLVSFEAFIQQNQFSPRQDTASRTAMKAQFYGFGVPQNKTHLIHFQCEEKKLKILMYLNNVERMQTHLGLIPNMRVRVMNAQLLNNNYAICNYLTTFAALGYHPDIRFDTMAPSRGFHMPVQEVCLSDGRQMPHNILVRARCSFFVRNLTLTVSAGPPGSPPQRRELALDAFFFAQDGRGEATVSCRHLKLLQGMLQLSDAAFAQWREVYVSGPRLLPHVFTLQNEKEYHFYNVQFEFIRFYQVFTESMKQHRRVKNMNAVIVCRKMFKKANQFSGKPHWFLTDIEEWHRPTIFA